jgi:hypothetical protein
MRYAATEALDDRPTHIPDQETTMPARKADKTPSPQSANRPSARRTRQGCHDAAGIDGVRQGKPAKAAAGDEPVFAYIASLPQPQRSIAECIDDLAASTLPGLQRSVKWGMSYYGVGDGWCFCCGGFADHVKLMFVNGAALEPVPPVTPGGDGQVDAGRGARIRGRPRQTPDRGVDETGRGRTRSRGEEAVGPHAADTSGATRI